MLKTDKNFIFYMRKKMKNCDLSINQMGIRITCSTESSWTLFVSKIKISGSAKRKTAQATCQKINFSF